MPDPLLGTVPPPGQVPSTATQPPPPPTAPPGNPTTDTTTGLGTQQVVQVVDLNDDGCWRDPLAAVRPVGQRPAKTARAARRAATRRHTARVVIHRPRRHVHTPRRKRK
jgi:hypothetical protein